MKGYYSLYNICTYISILSTAHPPEKQNVHVPIVSTPVIHLG